MRRFATAFLLGILAFGCLSGCGDREGKKVPTSTETGQGAVPKLMGGGDGGGNSLAPQVDKGGKK